MTPHPTGRVMHLEPDLQLRLSPVESGVELRLYRRAVSDVSPTGFRATEAGLRIPAPRLPEVLAALQELATTGSESGRK